MKFDLLVDSSALNDVANKSATYRLEMNETVKALKNETSAIPEAWKGEDANRVKQALDNAVSDLERVSNSYNELETLIKEANEKYTSIDSECASLLFKEENR